MTRPGETFKIGGCVSSDRSLGHLGTSAPRARSISFRCIQIVSPMRRSRWELSRERKQDRHQEGHHHHREVDHFPHSRESSLHFGEC